MFTTIAFTQKKNGKKIIKICKTIYIQYNNFDYWTRFLDDKLGLLLMETRVKTADYFIFIF